MSRSESDEREREAETGTLFRGQDVFNIPFSILHRGKREISTDGDSE